MANNAPVGNCLKDMAHIVKFDGTNHFDWKYEFLGILEQHGLKHLIEPTADGDILARPNVARNADNAITNQAAIDLWNQKDIIIRNSILISIDSSQKQNLYGLPTAREMWVKISTLFAAQADEIEQQLITRIFNYQHNPGLS
ncbi:hypothetical protein DAPPUDRAFT_244035 [Daphnia pulex]|uniref:Retrotransposon Copia-like N-terminal domain-containing protein n=1 Tax=Daphnia pulex TaxID=6669 RepID=E9GK14_DAPPU|nr:hypothetical protein DAPPUDRAFT_244035 [Daphnia pulex]|eukprot:EFX80232.1 hypothetical protein DAPPUDRAFT_244035 [Daphnia pulex]